MKKTIVVGDIFQTYRDGPIAVIEDKGLGVYLIEFIATGYQRLTRRSQVLTGNVKDKSVQGRRALKAKYRVFFKDSRVMNVVKLVDLLPHLEDQSKDKLYNFKNGKSSHPELEAIVSIKE